MNSYKNILFGAMLLLLWVSGCAPRGQFGAVRPDRSVGPLIQQRGLLVVREHKNWFGFTIRGKKAEVSVAGAVVGAILGGATGAAPPPPTTVPKKKYLGTDQLEDKVLVQLEDPESADKTLEFSLRRADVILAERTAKLLQRKLGLDADKIEIAKEPIAPKSLQTLGERMGDKTPIVLYVPMYFWGVKPIKQGYKEGYMVQVIAYPIVLMDPLDGKLFWVSLCGDWGGEQPMLYELEDLLKDDASLFKSALADRYDTCMMQIEEQWDGKWDMSYGLREPIDCKALPEDCNAKKHGSTRFFHAPKTP